MTGLGLWVLAPIRRTTPLFASLNVLDGTIIGRNMQRLGGPADALGELRQCPNGIGGSRTMMDSGRCGLWYST
jgi:hypothetical protein